MECNHLDLDQRLYLLEVHSSGSRRKLVCHLAPDLGLCTIQNPDSSSVRDRKRRGRIVRKTKFHPARAPPNKINYRKTDSLLHKQAGCPRDPAWDTHSPGTI
ncbi:hypothetical protein ATANTOWER_029099 [Ataeniobius toweri]|uniref:Uncharacterized protein n=1 Tax=Ataeniobius toweri TaxID=208326 RepID=A0ABU7AT29_9TELE|nr:hypothetical protein [Ataeniobius toweri]